MEPEPADPEPLALWPLPAEEDFVVVPTTGEREASGAPWVLGRPLQPVFAMKEMRPTNRRIDRDGKPAVFLSPVREWGATDWAAMLDLNEWLETVLPERRNTPDSNEGGLQMGDYGWS